MGNCRSFRTFLNCFIAIAIAFYSCFSNTLVAGLGFTLTKSSKQLACKRACIANQKTIAGANEMYNLDYNIEPCQSYKKLTPSHLKTLQDNGYLHAIPNDPGFGKNSSSNYKSTADGKHIFCINHGFVFTEQLSKLSKMASLNANSSAYEQLKAYGETSEFLLKSASKEPSNKIPFTSIIRRNTLEVLPNSALILFALFPLWFFIAVRHLRLWRPGQNIKIGFIIFSFFLAFYGFNITQFPFLIFPIQLIGFVILLILVDTCQWIVRFLFKCDLEKTNNGLILSQFSKMDKETFSYTRKKLGNTKDEYNISAKGMMYLCAISSFVYILYVLLKAIDIGLLALLPSVIPVFFIAGVFSGTTRFFGLISSSLNGSTVQIHMAVRIVCLCCIVLWFTGAFFFSLVDETLMGALPAAFSLIILSSFFGGRHFTVSRLTKRFVNSLSLLINSTNDISDSCNSGEGKVIKMNGISAHPSRDRQRTDHRTRRQQPNAPVARNFSKRVSNDLQ